MEVTKAQLQFLARLQKGSQTTSSYYLIRELLVSNLIERDDTEKWTLTQEGIGLLKRKGLMHNSQTRLGAIELENILRQLPLDTPQIEVFESPPTFIVTITSRSFSDMNEAEHQELVWHHLHEKLSDPYSVEFVCTNAPGEQPDF